MTHYELALAQQRIKVKKSNKELQKIQQTELKRWI